MALGAPTDRDDSNEQAIRCVSSAQDRCRLAWGGVGELLIEGDSRIIVRPTRGADDESLGQFVLGAGLGVLLHQRGMLVLHGSSVAVGDNAIGFVGQKGWGKSTTAGALAQLGHPLVSDELLAIRFAADGQPWIMPAASPIKLWSDALDSLHPDTAEPLRVRPGIDKFYLPAACTADREYPLRAIFVLDGGESLSAEPVNGKDAFFGVVPHLYVTRFGTPFLQASSSASWVFRQLQLLLAKTRIVRLIREQSLDRLKDIVALIESECLADSWTKPVATASVGCGFPESNRRSEET